MPLYKRRPFEAQEVPKDLKDDEEVYYLKLTNEIFRDYDDYYSRVILCNSMVWSCAMTGKANLTYEEALDSEKSAKKLLKGFQASVKKALLYVSTLTNRSKLADVVDDVLGYARDRYFKGEEVLSVIGNLWCPSRVINIIEPTAAEIEAYTKEQYEKGDAENNDYLKDDTWGPSPDIFRYEVEEIDVDRTIQSERYVLEAIDVKRERASLNRDKCKFLLKLAMDFDDQKRKFVLKDGILSAYGINKMKFSEIFIGKTPIFEVTLASVRGAATARSSAAKSSEKTPRSGSASKTSSPKSKSANSSQTSAGKKSGTIKGSNAKPKKLTPEEMKKLELERKAKEKEEIKSQRKMIADFKKLWFKPKEDLEVEDLKDLPTPDPISFKIPNNLFGDFMMVLEFMGSYSTFLKVRDCFPSGLTMDILERALYKNEIAGPYSDILQLLLRAVFRLQEGEQAEILGEGRKIGLDLIEVGNDVSIGVAVQQATSAAAWSHMHQNTPLHKLVVDYSSLTEVLRLHLLSSGAKQTQQSRGSVAENDDPGLYMRMDDPQILNTLSTGTVFDLTMSDKLKVIQCLVHQIVSYAAVKDIMEDNFELFKQARVSYRTLVAAEKKREIEDNLWRQKIKAERVMPDITALKVATESAVESGEDSKADKSKPPKLEKQLTDEQIEFALAKKDKETAKRKQEFAWKEAELLDQINKHERKLGAHPLGRDRAYRRYWIFPTVSGLFVEHDDEFVGSCLPTPTPHIGEVNLNDVKFIQENYEKLKQVDKEGSDKENSTLASPKKTSKKKSVPNTPSKKEVVRPPIFGLCTADEETCPVHCQSLSRPKWSFFWEPEHIDALIAGLTPRGIREKELRQNLEEAKDTLKGIIKKCPISKLNKEKYPPESVSTAPDRRPPRGAGSTKNQTDPNLGFPAGTSVTKIMELHLRDLILELEEKIFLGSLGSLKIGDRMEWRTAIENRKYNAGTDELKWGGDKSMSTPTETSEEGGDAPMEVDEESVTSSSSIVKKLACAILQLQQAVEIKFMNQPLVIVEREDEKKKKKHAEPAWKQIWNSTQTPLERWQLSLMNSKSFSQLFVHFYSLESSIEWSRSVLNARCRVCRRKGDPEKMLLCDTCNKGHHIYCLKPMLETLPKGDWYCRDCKDDEPLPTPSKKRTMGLTKEDIMEELDSEDDEGGEVVRRGTKRGLDEESDDDGDVEVCNICGYEGEVICCDNCPLVFHLLCLNPPKTRVPRGTWHCPECTNPKENKSKKKNAKKSPKKKLPVKRKLNYAEVSESETDEDEQEDQEAESDENRASDDEDDRVVKVKFGRSKKQSPEGPAAKVRKIIESSNDEESDQDLGRSGKRRCATAAAAKISEAAKRDRPSYVADQTSESSNDSNYNSRKRTFSDANELADCPKRTRLQRLHTNHKVLNGELDNVLLDKLISDVMKQNDAWPFLKPVTRTEAPDYQEIVKNPMDLGTIKYKLNSMVYTCNEEFISDLLLVFTNCTLYNDSNHPIHQSGQILKDYCEKKCSKLGINFSDPVPS